MCSLPDVQLLKSLDGHDSSVYSIPDTAYGTALAFPVCRIPYAAYCVLPVSVYELNTLT